MGRRPVLDLLAHGLRAALPGTHLRGSRDRTRSPRSVSEYDGDIDDRQLPDHGDRRHVTSTTLTPVVGLRGLRPVVTFTATVTGYGTPTGTVAFYAGPVSPPIRSAPARSSVENGHDVATFSTPTLPVERQSVRDHGGLRRRRQLPGQYVTRQARLTIKPDASTTSASASTTSGPFGQVVTITAKVTANAPGSGTPTGNVDFFDTTTGDDLGKITLSGGVATSSTACSATGLPTRSQVSYSGDSNFLASSTTASTITINQSIIVLDPTAGGALSISENASIKLTGGVYVDSSSSSALSASGNAQITASVIDVHGGVQKSGNASFNPAPVTKAATVSDPLAGLPVPEHDRPDQLWYRKPEREFQGDDQAGHLQPDHGLGQCQPDHERRPLHHRRRRFPGIRQRQRHRRRGDHLQYRQQVPEFGRYVRRDHPERQRHNQPEPTNHRVRMPGSSSSSPPPTRRR